MAKRKTIAELEKKIEKLEAQNLELFLSESGYRQEIAQLRKALQGISSILWLIESIQVDWRAQVSLYRKDGE